jgi:hypothetical protein
MGNSLHVYLHILYTFTYTVYSYMLREESRGLLEGGVVMRESCTRKQGKCAIVCVLCPVNITCPVNRSRKGSPMVMFFLFFFPGHHLP